MCMIVDVVGPRGSCVRREVDKSAVDAALESRKRVEDVLLDLERRRYLPVIRTKTRIPKTGCGQHST